MGNHGTPPQRSRIVPAWLDFKMLEGREKTTDSHPAVTYGTEENSNNQPTSYERAFYDSAKEKIYFKTSIEVCYNIPDS